jgi:hypothetical protein
MLVCVWSELRSRKQDRGFVTCAPTDVDVDDASVLADALIGKLRLSHPAVQGSAL